MGWAKRKKEGRQPAWADSGSRKPAIILDDQETRKVETFGTLGRVKEK